LTKLFLIYFIFRKAHGYDIDLTWMYIDSYWKLKTSTILKWFRTLPHIFFTKKLKT